PAGPGGGAVDDLLAPRPERLVLGVAALERDVVVLHEAGQLAGRALRLVALAVLDDVGVRGEPAALAEASLHHAVDLDQEIELPIGIVALAVRHDRFSSRT